MKIDGGCHCGNITFVAEADPGEVRLCHCTDCQQLTGGPYRVVVPVRKDRIEWRGGQAKVYVKTAESGARRIQAFCPECGTPVYSAPEGNAEVYGLRLGTIRQRAELRPAKQIWCRSALGWIRDLESIPQFAKQ